MLAAALSTTVRDDIDINTLDTTPQDSLQHGTQQRTGFSDGLSAVYNQADKKGSLLNKAPAGMGTYIPQIRKTPPTSEPRNEQTKLGESMNRISRVVPLVRPVYVDRSGPGGSLSVVLPSSSKTYNPEDYEDESGVSGYGKQQKNLKGNSKEFSQAFQEMSLGTSTGGNRKSANLPSTPPMAKSRTIGTSSAPGSADSATRRLTLASSKPSLLPIPTTSPSPKSKTPTASTSHRHSLSVNALQGRVPKADASSSATKATATASTFTYGNTRHSTSSVAVGAAHIQQLHHQMTTTSGGTRLQRSMTVGSINTQPSQQQQQQKQHQQGYPGRNSGGSTSNKTAQRNISSSSSSSKKSQSTSSNVRTASTTASNTPPSSSHQTPSNTSQLMSRSGSQPNVTTTTTTTTSSGATSLKLPLTPESTLHYYKDLLTPFEQREVFEYPEVYFAGAGGVEKVGSSRRRTGADGPPNEMNEKDEQKGVYNGGYDDSRGDYYLTHHDHIAYRYEIVSLLGKGSFGQVVKCYDHKLKTHVALKIIRNKKRFEKQGMVEVKVLDKLRNEDSEKSHNLIHMLDYFHFRNHLCITFELLGINLYEWLKAGGFRGVHAGVIKLFAVQILGCMSLLAKNNIVHCDLKPENVLLADTAFLQPNRCDLGITTTDPTTSHRSTSFIPPDFDPSSPLYTIKVIDFGSSCFESEKVYTYVQSRFYRSPEVIMGIPYTVSIDMWSLGCILAEMYTGYPLFPGENEQEQLSCIMEILGPPPAYLVELGSRSKLFFDAGGQPKITPNSKGRKRRPGTKTLGGVLKTGDAGMLGFLGRCLEWDPERRMGPEEALGHEWVRDILSGKKVGGKNAVSGGGGVVVKKQQQQQQQQRGEESFNKPASGSVRKPVQYELPSSSSTVSTSTSTANIPMTKSRSYRHSMFPTVDTSNLHHGAYTHHQTNKQPYSAGASGYNPSQQMTMSYSNSSSSYYGNSGPRELMGGGGGGLPPISGSKVLPTPNSANAGVVGAGVPSSTLGYRSSTVSSHSKSNSNNNNSGSGGHYYHGYAARGGSGVVAGGMAGGNATGSKKGGGLNHAAWRN
ncbi:Dual specificity tyrosine-phosphorylation-regulated kinase [Chytridiales sp. JEL 0842]|nr:Dual specificity tyrosine-phosphorylation-regulated kinase [Chytridiales sp. JEL 0842]